MSHWKITISGKGVRKKSVEDFAKALMHGFGNGVTVQVTDNTPPKSRTDRYSAAQSQVSNAKSDAEGLKDELQEWFDNLPENFQSGDKGDTIQNAISQLEEFIDQCEQAEGVDVEFPGMY